MIEHVRRWRDFELLREEWDQVAAPVRSPLLEHDWFLACAETLHAEEDLNVVVVREGGRLVAAAPLVISRSSGERLMQLGASTLHEPTGWLAESENALQELFTAVLAAGRPTQLQRIPVDSPVCRMAQGLRRATALTVLRPTARSCVVHISGQWDDYYAGLSRKIRHNLPRVRARAEKTIGKLRLDVLQPAPPEVEDLVRLFARVESSGWKGRQRSSLSARPELYRFFLRYARLAASRGTLRVAILKFGTHVAAIELAVEAHDRMWQLKIGHEEALAQYYPGLLLTQASIQRAFERRLAAYEFLGSAEPWEERWNPDFHAYCLVAMYPLTARAMGGACRDMAGFAARRLRRVVQSAISR